MLVEKAKNEEVKQIVYSPIFHNAGLKIQTVEMLYFEKDNVERNFRLIKREYS
jgi:hypothetical protein